MAKIIFSTNPAEMTHEDEKPTRQRSLAGSLWQRNTNEAIWPERQVNEEC